MKARKIQMAMLLLCILAVISFTAWYRPTTTQAQVRISDTPVRVVIPEATQPATPVNVLTSTPTFTPTAPPPEVFLEAAAPLGDIIVLDFPETGAYLGSLETGRQYPITGQYFSWIQFEYPAAVNGLAWVYFETVRVIGDVSKINIISDPRAASASAEDNQTLTAEAELLTPSIAETASAEARILILPTAEVTTVGNQTSFPPTFTPPPDAVVRAPTQAEGEILEPAPTPSLVETAVALVENRTLAPIVPILLLGGFGTLGLLISIIRNR